MVAKRFIKSILLVASAFFLVAESLLAQQPAIEETSKYYYLDNPQKLIELENSLNDLEEHNFVYREGWEYRNLGNTGTAHRSLFYKWNDKKGFKSGMHHFDLYKFSVEKIKYYQISKPLSEIAYSIGTNREHIFRGTHAQNIKNRFLLGIDFHRIASEGIYARQKTRNAGFASYGKFTSDDGKYNFGYQIAYSQIKAQENGGMRENILDENFTLPFNLQLLPTNLGNNAITEHKNLDANIFNAYNLGFYQIDSINDSLQVRKFYKVFELKHTLGIQNNKFGFKDMNPVKNYYNIFYQGRDSIFYDLHYRSLPNKFSITYHGAQKGDSVTYFKLWGEAGLQHDYLRVMQFTDTVNYQNVHVFGTISTNPNISSKLKFSASTYYFLSGYNRNDLHVSGRLGYDFGQWGEVTASLIFENAEPEWIEQNYSSSTLNWSIDFKKKQNLQIGGEYYLSKYKIKVNAQYNTLGGLIYFDNLASPRQLDEVVSYWNFSLQKLLKWKILHFDNFAGFQGVSKSEIVRLPKVFLKSSLYVEGKIFKGNMLGRVGVDMRYNTNFVLEAWNPLIGQFYLQNEQNSRFLPVFDFFLSFQVQTVRVFAKSNYISQGLMGRNFYNFANYPDRGRTFAGGLVWRFLE